MVIGDGVIVSVMRSMCSMRCHRWFTESCKYALRFLPHSFLARISVTQKHSTDNERLVVHTLIYKPDNERLVVHTLIYKPDNERLVVHTLTYKPDNERLVVHTLTYKPDELMYNIFVHAYI